MSVTRVGTTKQYSDNWDNIFGGRNGRSAPKKKTVSATGKSAKKKPAKKKTPRKAAKKRSRRK